MSDTLQHDEIHLYVQHARHMLDVAEHNLAAAFHGSAVNRAYYAVFYSASALLATLGQSRSKHSGVMAAFRQQFIKPGLVEVEYSRIYERLMDDRQTGDYDLEAVIEPDRARADVDDARRFVARVERLFREQGWL
jgi:uncharacterized protein (UPF0332 family)